MLTHTLVATIIAAAGVHAVAQPQITAPPSLKHRRDIFDDARSIINSATSAIGGVVDDTKSVIDDTKSVAACFDKIEDIIDDYAPPRATGDLGSAVTSYMATAGNMCAESAIPSSLLSSWSAYESSYVSWYSTASAAIQTAADACPDVDPSLQNAIKSAFPCSTALSNAGLTAVAFDGAPTDAPSATNGENAAPKVTGIAVGAAAFAVGAAAALL